MRILVLSNEADIADVVPALVVLSHEIDLCPYTVQVLLEHDEPDVIMVDARKDLATARTICRTLAQVSHAPRVPVLTEGGLIALSSEWNIDDLLLPSTTPAEIEARLRLIVSRCAAAGDDEEEGVTTLGDLVIDENTYVARLKGKPLDLAYKEFELLKFLCHHAGRVFTRSQLLQEVWGYDFFGGTRTVDVHVRRLRAKLGSDYESLIMTVRNVGYKAEVPVSYRKAESKRK